MWEVERIKNSLNLGDFRNRRGLNVSQKPTDVLLPFLGGLGAADCNDLAILLNGSQKVNNQFQGWARFDFDSHDGWAPHTLGLNSVSENVVNFVQALLNQFLLGDGSVAARG